MIAELQVPSQVNNTSKTLIRMHKRSTTKKSASTLIGRIARQMVDDNMCKRCELIVTKEDDGSRIKGKNVK